MIKVKWDLEEAVVLYDLYFKSGATLSVDTEKLNELSAIMKNRAAVKGVQIDEKYRNVTGLTMQLSKLRKSSAESVENTNAFNHFKEYLHVERHVEIELQNTGAGSTCRNRKFL